MRVQRSGRFDTLENITNMILMYKQKKEEEEKQRHLLELLGRAGKLASQGKQETFVPPFEPTYQPPQPAPDSNILAGVPTAASGFNVPGYDPNVVQTTSRPLEMYEFIQQLSSQGRGMGADPAAVLQAVSVLGPSVQASLEDWNERNEDTKNKEEISRNLIGLSESGSLEEATPFIGGLINAGFKGISPLLERFKAHNPNTSVVRSGQRNVLIDDATGAIIQEYSPIMEAGTSGGGGGDTVPSRTDLAAMEKWLFGEEIILGDQIMRTSGVLGRYPLEEGAMTQEQYQQSLANVMNEIQQVWGEHPEKVQKLKHWVMTSPRSPFSKGAGAYVVEPDPAIDQSGGKSGLLNFFFGPGGLLSGKPPEPTKQTEGKGQPISWKEYQYLLDQGKTDKEIEEAGYIVPKR